MARYSRCTNCGDKIDRYIGTGNIKIGPCCARAETNAMFVVGIHSQEELNNWYRKFRPGKLPPTIKVGS